MKILSLQSSVAHGYVGNSAAVFPLQRLGFEVLAVDTVQFSNHPGYGQWSGAMMEPGHVRAVLGGLDAVGALAQCGAVLSGYLGEAAMGPAVVDALGRVRAHRPDALYLCDPVLGDESGLYVRPGIPDFIAHHLLPKADVVTPNRFELEYLSGMRAADVGDAVVAARRLLERGPRLVVATGIVGNGVIATVAVAPEGAWAVRTPDLPFDPPISGSGDTLAALLLGHLLRGEAIAAALSLAVSGLFGVLQKTHALGRRELALIQAQDDFLAPSRLFPAVIVG